MNKKNIKKNKGFVILFAVMISSIIFSIAVGVSNVALKEINFSTSAKKTNDAFFAADVGAECAIFYDIKGGSEIFKPDGNILPIKCTDLEIAPVLNSDRFIENSKKISGEDYFYYSFDVVRLGKDEKACAKVLIVKDRVTTVDYVTTITSKGYNSGSSGDRCMPEQNDVERELQLVY